MALKGKTEPRIWTPPLRELTPETTLGYDMVDFSRNVLGIEPLPWQQWLFVHAFEIVGDFGGEWHLRFRVALVLVARQNGKTYITKLIALFFLYMLGVSLILGTAQDLGQAEETWEATVNEAMEHEDLSAEIVKTYNGKGSKELRLTGYRRYKVATPNEKNTRGKSADLVFLDELRTHKTFDAWAAASKTIKARISAIVWCISNAGNGSSVVLRHLRKQAHRLIGDPDGIVAESEGSDPEEMTEDELAALGSIAIFEWSAPLGCDKWDREAWAQANPSLGYGFLTEDAIASDCVSDPEDDFRIEDLCQWITATTAPPFPVGAWEAGKDEKSLIAPDSPLKFGVDVSADRKHAAIVVCGERADHHWHVEVAEYRENVGWLVAWFRDRVMRYGGRMQVALQGGSAPVATMKDLLAAIDGVEVTECKGAMVSQWCGRFYDAVAALSPEEDSEDAGERAVPVHHVPQAVLDLAANVAKTRPSGDGMWTWNRDRSSADISPLVAASMAFGLATEVVEEKAASVYEDNDVMFLD